MSITLALALASAHSPAQSEPSLVYSDSLAPAISLIPAPVDEHNGKRFWYSQPEEWSFTDSVLDDGLGNPVPDSGPCLSFKSTQSYRPRVRSPHSLAILRGVHLEREHAFEVEAMQTGPETAHRDLVLVFGFESPEQFYYAHLGKTPDAVSSNVFNVDEAPRRRVGEIGTKTIEWGRGVWHRLRVECNGKGHVRIYVDDMETPHFEVDLGHLVKGQIGFGSFDDAGAFRNLKVYEQSSRYDWTSSSGARAQAEALNWKTSPFGGIAGTAAAAPRFFGDIGFDWSTGSDREANRKNLWLDVDGGRGGVHVVLMDVDGNNLFDARVDRWMVTKWSYLLPGPPDFMLALDEPAITSDRIAMQPVLEADGSFAKPYRFRMSVPTQSRSGFLKAQYTRHSEGHAPVGPWRWVLNPETRSPRSRLTLCALTPSDQPESWRWDAEIFSDPEVAKRLQENFTLVRCETGPRRMGSNLISFVAVFSVGANNPTALRGESPVLLMFNAAGAPLGTTTQLDSAEALLEWLQKTEVAKPLDIRGPFQRSYR